MFERKVLRAIDGAMQDVGVWRNFELYALYKRTKFDGKLETASLRWVDLCNVARTHKIPIRTTQFKIKEE